MNFLVYIFFLSLMVSFFSCSDLKHESKKVKPLTFLNEGFFSRKELLLESFSVPEDIQMNDSLKIYIKLVVTNVSKKKLILPVENFNSTLIYVPQSIRFKLIRDTTNDASSIIECYKCNFEVELLPSSKITLITYVGDFYQYKHDVTLFLPYIENKDAGSERSEFIIKAK